MAGSTHKATFTKFYTYNVVLYVDMAFLLILKNMHCKHLYSDTLNCILPCIFFFEKYFSISNSAYKHFDLYLHIY